MNDRGQYGNREADRGRGCLAASRVGAQPWLWHTIAEREEVLRYLKAAASLTYQELTQQILHATPEHPYGLASDTTIRPDWFTWWKYRAEPFFVEFRDWAAARSPENLSRFGGYVAYGEQFTTDWEAYRQWTERLNALRREAKEIGIQFRLPLPRTRFVEIGRLSRGYMPGGTYVGQGSLFGHTPGDVENELDQLHNEIMGFGQQLIELIKKEEDQARAVVQKEHDEESAAWKVTESFQSLVKERDRLREVVAKNVWRTPELAAAETALEKFMPAAKRQEAIAHARELSQKRADLEHKAQGERPLTQWKRSTWDPFFAGWTKFRNEKKDIPLQSWPLSGTWDRIQDYRKQFVDLYNKGPFTPTGPKPLDPDRKDPSLTSGLEEIAKIGKYALIGALGIGGIVVLSKVASNSRKGGR